MDKLGYPELTDDLFTKMTDLLYDESGITLKDHKKYLVIHRLSKLVGIGKPFSSFEEYFSALKNDRSGDMLIDFINALTTNFSFFFREEYHFEVLKKYLSDHWRKEPYLRIWSAACSTGEEPYSIAISCNQAISEPKKIDLKILATDISTKVLEIAEKGAYHYTKIRGHIEDDELKRYFLLNREKNSFIVKPEVKDLITFRYLNIMDDLPFKKMFDIVFLRNVLIYFENREKEYIINKIYDYIKTDGYLILGLSESLVGIKNSFVSMKNSIYRKA